MAQHPVYILPSTPDEFNLSFYQRYDPAFLFNKVVALKDILDRKEEITARRGQMEDLADDAGAASFEALQAEIHFTEMHQFEVFFMLLLADFQRVPHWIYLTEYPPSMPRQKAEQYIAKETGALTGDRSPGRPSSATRSIALLSQPIPTSYTGGRKTVTRSPRSLSAWRSGISDICEAITPISMAFAS